MTKPKAHLLIFEGAELCGKSWLMGQIYNFLEKKYNHSKVILDGCHWINADIGIFGTPHGQKILALYMRLLKALSEKHIIIEKFHISDIVYNRLYHKKERRYDSLEKELKKLNAKIIFPTFPENTALLEGRIQDRLRLYPHYKRILKKAAWYILEQQEYSREVEKSTLPHLQIEIERFPNTQAVKNILRWIEET